MNLMKELILHSNLKPNCSTCDFSSHFNGCGYTCTNVNCIYYNPRCDNKYLKSPIEYCDCWIPNRSDTIKIMQKYIREIVYWRNK